MATFKKFEDIVAWQKARLFCKEVNEICKTTELGRDYKLKDQINGSSGSIMDNIAEGFGRGGNAEFIQFLEISYASSCESQSQLYRVYDRKYIDDLTFKQLYDLVELIKNTVLSLIRYLSSSTMKGPKFKLKTNKLK